MRLDNGLTQADKRRAARLAVVHLFLECFYAVHAQQRRQLGQYVFLEHILHHGGHEKRRALNAFEQDIAREAVGNNHVRAAQRHVARFNVASKVDCTVLACLL